MWIVLFLPSVELRQAFLHLGLCWLWASRILLLLCWGIFPVTLRSRMFQHETTWTLWKASSASLIMIFVFKSILSLIFLSPFMWLMTFNWLVYVNPPQNFREKANLVKVDNLFFFWYLYSVCKSLLDIFESVFIRTVDL